MTTTSASSAGNLDLGLLVAVVHKFAMRCYERLIEIPGWLLDGGNRFFWVYLLSFAALAWLAREVYYRNSADRGGSFLGFLFPAEIYKHPSSALDLKLLLANRILGPSTFLSGVLLSGASISYVATVVQTALLDLAGTEYATRELGFGLGCAVILCLTFARDFSSYATHALHHRLPLLWAFHKVHHSAEVLTPFTVYRKHPLYNLLSKVTDLAIVGPAQGLVLFLFASTPEPLLLFGVNVIFSTFHLLGSNLRHSHIWLSFGPALSRIIISPAQHQIHHSRAERHWDRNYGEVFALWDWLFGTLYIPGKEREVIEFGVAGETTQAHPTLLAAYFTPFGDCARLLTGYWHVLFNRDRAPPRVHSGE